MFYYCNFSTKKHLQIAIKHLKIMGDHLAINFRMPFIGPLDPSQNRCIVGPPGLSGGPGPLGARRNSTTDLDIRSKCENCFANNSFQSRRGESRQ